MKKTKKVSKKLSPELQQCYNYGYDAGKNGANLQNAHFTIFGTVERTRAWIQGNDDGSNDRIIASRTKDGHTTKGFK